MNITVDGIIYQNQSHGGVSHLYDEILPRMCDEDDSLNINLLTLGRCKKALPVHSHIYHQALFPIDNLLRPTRIWKSSRFHIRAYIQHLTYQAEKGSIWHSTFFTMPYSWNGPVVASVYDLIYERFAQDIFINPIFDDLRIYQRKCLERADLAICISEATKMDLENFLQFDPKKIRVIHLAASPVFRQMENKETLTMLGTSKSFLLYVGGRHRYKNFWKFLKAFSILSKKDDVDLVVVGTTWTRQERDMLKELKINDRIYLLIDVDSNQLALLYNQALAFVFPSLYEGFGIPLLEAMACGCPIAASRIPSTIEVAGECPVYFEPKEVDSIVLALEIILNEGRDYKRVNLGLKRVSRFSWDITANETLNVYHELTTTS